MSRKILITGGNGFVGRHLLPLFSGSEDEIHVLDLDVGEVAGVVYHQVDLADAAATRDLTGQINASHLVHLAWHVPPSEFWTSKENVAWVDRSMNLLKSFSDSGGKRAVMIGSCAEYDWSSGSCDEEKTPLNPATLYGKCKKEVFERAKEFAAGAGLSFAWARLFFMFGEGEPSEKLISYLVTTMLKGEQAVCKNAGLVRDYLYIKDVVSGIKKLIDTELQGPVNICSGELRTVGEIAEQVARMLAKEEFLYLANPASSSEPASILGTNDKLTQIGWRPEYGFDPGLREFVSTFR